MKDGKAAGPESIPAELLKYGGECTAGLLHGFVAEAWRTGEVSQQWKDSNIVSIYKNKGDRAICGNSRGISLLSSGGKVFARVLLARLIDKISSRVLPESQCGFQRDRSILDMIITAREDKGTTR